MKRICKIMDFQKQGKKNRRKGQDFERKVRKELEEEGWWVNKHNNNIDLINNCFIQAKSNRFCMRQGGFPDFLIFQESKHRKGRPNYLIKFVECKMGKYLDKDEKEKIRWLKEQGFECFIAYNDDEGKVRYRKSLEC